MVRITVSAELVTLRVLTWCERSRWYRTTCAAAHLEPHWARLPIVVVGRGEVLFGMATVRISLALPVGQRTEADVRPP